ncbi:MAG TPA: hypothetical protein VJ723_13390, partial [Candidatus Angelobacter sp.]|nr:hypothetical protein [Candidatus Angelobacter sp.]
FRNVSGKEVRRLTLVGQIGNPSDPEINRGPVYRNPYTSGPDADTLALVLPSGDSGENVNQLPPTSALVALAMQLRSNCVHMAVVVELVEFSDGTQWVNQERSLWQKSLTADSAKRCDNSPRVQEAMRQLQGGSFTVVREPSHPDQKMQPSYSYSCSMHKDENYKFAHCPF